MGRVAESHSYKVKNTFVELGPGDDAERGRGRRAFSDGAEIKKHLEELTVKPVLLKSDETSCAVPDTPSPFLHPSVAGQNDILSQGLGFGQDMELPPSFGELSDSVYGMTMPNFENPDMAGFVPPMMFDPACGAYFPCGWCMPMDGNVPNFDGIAPSPTNGGENEPVQGGITEGATFEGFTDGSQVTLEALLAGQGMQQNIESDHQPIGEGLPDGQAWCPDGGIILDQSCLGHEGMAEGHAWNPDGNLSLEQGCGLLEGQAWGPDGNVIMELKDSSMEAHGWNPDAIGIDQAHGWSGEGNMQIDQATAWNAEGGMSLEQACGMMDLGENSAWNAEGMQLLNEERPTGDDQFADKQSGWDHEGSSPRERRGGGKDRSREDGRNNWRSKGGRGRNRHEKDELDAKLEAKDDGGAINHAEASSGPVGYTTVMLRNIPNKYTREMLVKQLNQDWRGVFDFVYLPIDFKNRCNVGYGFINFRTVEACADFVNKFNGVDVRKCLPGLNSRKVAEVTPARVQGIEENVRRLRNGPVMNELINHPEWMPLLLDHDGEETPFPAPDQPCAPVKPRRRPRDENGGRSWT